MNDEILYRDWLSEDREMLTRLLAHLKSKKYLISASLYKDIESAISLCMRLKDTIDGPPPMRPIVPEPVPVPSTTAEMFPVIEDDVTSRPRYFKFF